MDHLTTTHIPNPHPAPQRAHLSSRRPAPVEILEIENTTPLSLGTQIGSLHHRNVPLPRTRTPSGSTLQLAFPPPVFMRERNVTQWPGCHSSQRGTSVCSRRRRRMVGSPGMFLFDGWPTDGICRFLLNYTTRDEVNLLGRGSGGLVEVKETVDQYGEPSPLYGFINYRRRKVILKYIPEGTSRLLQGM